MATTDIDRTFTVADYVVFGISLALSLAIGVFYAIKDRKKQSTEQMFLGGRQMSAIPVALSLLASFQSAVSIIGVPNEVYFQGTMYTYFLLGAIPAVLCCNYIFVPVFYNLRVTSAFESAVSIIGVPNEVYFQGTMYTYFLLGAIPAVLCCNYIFVPVFYNLRVTSAFEYLSLRFSMPVRTLAAVIFAIQMLLYMAVVLYAPALALSAVTGFPLWPVVMIVGAVCIIYTTIGGMKAVIWTDAFQMVVIVAGLLAVLIQGSIDIGGFGTAWEKAELRGVVEFDNFSFDPTVRHSFWSLTIGGMFTGIAIYGTNQAQIQRACSCPTLTKARLAYWLNVPGIIVTNLIYIMIGILMVAKYSDCDPTISDQISTYGQTMPFYVIDTLGKFSGLPGLFTACLFSGALSTISSGINALAAVALQDIITPYAPKMREKTASRLAIGLVFLFGGICLALTYVASLLQGLLQTAFSLFGIIGGPILGVFILGLLFPWANSYGAFTGLVLSLAMSLWVGINNQLYNDPQRIIPQLDVSGCGFNFTPNIPPNTKDDDGLSIYFLSYMYYAPFAVLIMVVVGLIVSVISGFFVGFTKASDLSPDLFCPILYNLCCCLPEKIRRKLLCGVSEMPDISDEQRNTDPRTANLEVKPPKESFHLGKTSDKYTLSE